MVGCDPQNEHAFGSERRLASVALVCSKTYCRLCVRYGKTAVLALVLPNLETFGFFHDSRVRYPHFYGFPPKSWRSVVCNWSCGAFGVLQTTRSFSFGLEQRYTDRGTTESRIVFRATTDLCQISDRSVDIQKNGGRKKNIFSTHNR